MTQFRYIAVSLHGHFDGKLAVRYSFTPEGIDPRWQSSLPDPDAIVRNFVSARECYVMWQNANGHYFSVITTNPLDPRTGRVMVTVMVKDGDALTGRSIFTLLCSLKKAFLEEDRLNDEAVAQVLSAADLPADPLELNSWRVALPKADAKPMCYRTYLSTRELEGVFSFPNQAEYTGYTYVIVITATSSLRPGVAVDRLTGPVKKSYTVICPAGVTSSSAVAIEGDHLTLTFTKDGFNTRKETVTVGTPSPYVKYDGAALIVKAPAESGLGFVKRVKLNVTSSKGGLINGYTVTVNDRPINTMEPFVELTEADLRPDRKIIIQAASNNFNPLKMEVDPATITRETILDLIMTPLEQGIILRLDFGEGRVFEQTISIEKNTPEYSQLHSGTFHGFRAHRMATPGGEVYTVDVRAAGKPVPPSFDNVATKRNADDTHQRVVPVFENVSDTSGHKPAPKAPEFERATDTAAKADKQEKKADDTTPRKPISWGLIASLVAIVLIIVLAAIFLPKWASGEPKIAKLPTDSIEAVKSANTEASTLAETPNALAPDTKPVEAAPAANTNAAPTADEAADIEYLNANRAWKRSDLKSDTYRKLYDAMLAGDIKAIVNHPYFAVARRATQKEANNCADMLWAAYGTPNAPSNVKMMKKIVKEESVNLWDLYEGLARCKPADPNTTPRPGK